MIHYDFARMAQLSADLDRDFGALTSLSEQLKSEVAKLNSNWQSVQASEAYNAAQHTWDGAFGDTRTHLKRLSTEVQSSADRMRQADTRAAGFFH